MAKNGKPVQMKQFKTYRFRTYDPAIEEVLEFIGNGRGNMSEAARESGVSISTFRNWRNKNVRRPQNCTIEAAGRARGKKRVWVDM